MRHGLSLLLRIRSKARREATLAFYASLATAIAEISPGAPSLQMPTGLLDKPTAMLLHCPVSPAPHPNKVMHSDCATNRILKAQGFTPRWPDTNRYLTITSRSPRRPYNAANSLPIDLARSSCF